MILTSIPQDALNIDHASVKMTDIINSEITMPNTYIVLRQSPDWGAISDSEFREQSRKFCIQEGRPPEQVNLSVDLWNRTFKRSFCQVRQEIKEIALANFASVKNTTLLNSIETINTTHLDEGVYIFIDDDDWLHPQIADLLSNIDSDRQTNGFVWGSVAFGRHAEEIITRRNIDGFCYTNNYAVKGVYIKNNIQDLNALSKHGEADKILNKYGARIIKDYWSVTNKNPTSTCYMEQVLKGNYSQPLLTGAIANYLERCQRIDSEIDPSLTWARPMMLEMVRIFSELM